MFEPDQRLLPAYFKLAGWTTAAILRTIKSSAGQDNY